MKEYTILARPTRSHLQDVVRSYLNVGWLLIGAPFVHEGHVCQAVGWEDNISSRDFRCIEPAFPKEKTNEISTSKNREKLPKASVES